MLIDEGRKSFNRAIEAHVVVGNAKNEVAGRHLECRRIILARRAGSDADDRAVIAPKLIEQRALSGVARIIADNDFDFGARPRAGLCDPGDRGRAVTVRGEHNGKLH